MFEHQPETWILPPIILFVAARLPGRGRGAGRDSDRQLEAVSRMSRSDGVEARMVLFVDPAAPLLDDVRPALAWLAREACRAPMPRRLYVARLADLASDRSGLLATLDDLASADVAVRACDPLLPDAVRLRAACVGAAAVSTPANAPSPAIVPASHLEVAAPSPRRPAAPSPAPAATRAP